MAHDVFVSYSSTDKSVADAVVAGLERKGIRCWVAPRDLTPGISWGQGIAEAIETSTVMVVILSENANQSKQVAREVERAISKDVAVIPFRIQNIDPTGAIAYFLSSEHWLDAITPPLERHIDKLGNVIQSFLKEDNYGSDSIYVVDQQQEIKKPTDVKEPSIWSKKSNKAFILGALGIAFVCLVTVIIGVFLILPGLRRSLSPEISSINEDTAITVNDEATPTETLTPTGTATPADTPTETSTSTPTVTSTSTSISGLDLPEDWIEYTTMEFAIGLPARWEVVDIDQEGMDALMSLLVEFDPSWAEIIESTYTTGETTPPLFFAMDTEMVGLGYANINVNKETLPIAVPIGAICSELDVIYVQSGMDIQENDCSLSINGLPAARYQVGMSMGPISTTQYQYLYMNGKDFWIINFSSEESGWSEYQPIFIAIAETFTIFD